MEQTNIARAEQAYDAYAAQLYRVAYSLLQSRESAEDAVQDAFARYLAHDGRFRDSEHEKAWLIRVTVNRCRDLQRAGAVRAYTPLEEVLQHPDRSGQDHLEGQPVDTVAQARRLTPSAVKMRLKRGREMLQTILAKEDIHV